MKKMVLSFTMALVISGITLFSCKKNDSKDAESTVIKGKNSFDSNNPDITSMRQELVLFDLNVQKQIFNSLSAEKKALLWHDKIVQVLKTNKFSNYQTQLLEELNNQISKDLYEVGSDKEQDFKENFHPVWIEKAKGQFVFDELMMIVFLLDDFDQNKIIIGGGSGDRYDDCECSTKSDWCTFGRSCRMQNCNDSAHGCGTLWTYACRGMCNWN